MLMLGVGGAVPLKENQPNILVMVHSVTFRCATEFWK